MSEKIQRMFKGIFAKFVLAFIIVGLMPVMGMSYLVFNRLPGEIEKYMIANYEEVLLYTSKNIEIKLKEYNDLTTSIYSFGRGEHQTVAEALEGQVYTDLPLESSRVISDYLRSLLYSDAYLESVFLIDEQRKLIDYYSKSSSYYYEDIDFGQYSRFEELYKDNRSVVIIPSHHEAYFRKNDKMVVTFARNYLDIDSLPENESVVATLLIDINQKFIDDIVSRMDLNDKGKIYITDSFGDDIYRSKGGEVTSQVLRELDELIDDSTSGYITEKDQFTFYHAVEASDWMLFYMVDKSNIMNLIDGLRAITSVLIIAIIIALICIAVIFSTSLSRPIRHIIKQMHQVAEGDLDSKVEVVGSNEMNQLAEEFNKMTQRLKGYINYAYGAQIKQREAELNAIKTQIRPHYLYNTLEIIRMSAVEEEAANTQEMIESLSEQLKYAIGQSGDRVTLGQEIDMIKNYFNIIRVRFDNRIRLELDIPKKYQNVLVLKLLLQPLVENAVVHGLKVKKGIGKVKVSIKSIDDHLRIQVIDDGVGMDEQTMSEMKELLVGEKMGKELDGNWANIGLKNVHDRIQMVYGDDYGLTMSSKVNFGTKMTITIPVE